MKFISVLILLQCATCLADGPAVFDGGSAVIVAKVNSAMTTALVDSATEWCTPATLIGPRTFITAAHCTAFLQSGLPLKVEGPGINEQVHVTILSQPVMSDDDSFSADNCKHLFNILNNGDVLTPQQLLTCWAQNGQSDVALLIADHDIPGPMANISSQPIRANETLNLLGEAPSCGGNLGYYRSTAFSVFGFNHSQVVLNGSATGIGGVDSSACGGDSGGIYYRSESNLSIEIAAIHTGGTHDQKEQATLNGKSVFLPAHFAGGTNLADPDVVAWLNQMAQVNNLGICGLNISCPAIHF